MKFAPRYRKLNFWHKFSFWASVLGIVSLVLFVISWAGGPIKSNQEEIKRNHEETLTLLQKMALTSKTDDDMLIRQYPLGYVLFAIDHRKIVIPYEDKLGPSEKIRIDWESMKIVELTADTIIIKPPNVAGHTFKNIHIRCRRTPGLKQNVFAAMGWKGVYFEVIEDRPPEGVICLIGFSEE